MGQPNECSCQCGIEAAKKYTCYNGFCVEDDLGEYNEPTCGGNCPQPTQYACVSGYCIPTVGGAYNNPSCNGNCPTMPRKRYSCINNVCSQAVGGQYFDPACLNVCSPRFIEYQCTTELHNNPTKCVPTPGGPYKNDPTCGGNCNPGYTRYLCDVNGACVQNPNGMYWDDPTCGGNCEPGVLLYKCQDGGCVQAIDGTYSDDPTCGGNCGDSSANYLLVNCQNENETIVATAQSGTYSPPFNGVWKIDNECWRMVGETECPCSPPPITLPDTRTPGCDSCNNGVCCFEVWPCAWQGGEVPENGFSCNTNTGKCEPSLGGEYGPACGGYCDTFSYKICVSGLNPTDCQSYVNKIIKIYPCGDRYGYGGPPCTPAPGWIGFQTGQCRCCFNVINSIPEDLEATHHNLVNIYSNCCECNPCDETKTCNPGETFIGDCNQCDCVCLDPPCGGEPPTTGACCYADCDSISCIEDVTEEECAEYYNENGTFIPGGTCSACEVEPCNPSTGECCGGYECDGFGNCVRVAVGVSIEECQSTCYAPE